MRTSGFKDIPVSLGLALETLVDPTEESVDPDRDKPDSGRLSRMEVLSFDVYSLMRDVIGSTDDLRLSMVDEILASFSKCCTSINNIPELMGFCEFHNSFSDKYFQKGRMIDRDGDSKVDIKEQLLNKCMKRASFSDYVDVKQFIGSDSRYLVYSHHVMHLAKVTRGNSTVNILESHSGKILVRHELNKKYRKNRFMDIKLLPFCTHLVKTVGDGNYIRGLPDEQLKVLGELATKWNPQTTAGNVLVTLLKAKL